MKKWWKDWWWVVLTIVLIVGTFLLLVFDNSDISYAPLMTGVVVKKTYYPANGGLFYYNPERFYLTVYNEIDDKKYINTLSVPEYQYRQYKVGDWWWREQ